MKILVIGANGMIGNAVLRVLSEKNEWQVFGTVRNAAAYKLLSVQLRERIIEGVDVEKIDHLVQVLNQVRPNVVVNCAGLTKHRFGAEEPLVSIPINTLIPHRLASLCKLINARFIHVSTDCVFSGEKGNYSEGDLADARDVYGRSKALGEVIYPHAVTLRTSTVGHELQTRYGLLEWFLSQDEGCKGYNKAIFSGFPTVVFAQIVRDFVIPNTQLFGLYHVASKPICKYDLLKLIARVYGKELEIYKDDTLRVDRSLNPELFCKDTGYVAPEWEDMINTMYAYR